MNIIVTPLFIVLGIGIIINPTFYWEKIHQYVDLAGWPQWTLGPGFIIYGIYWFILDRRVTKKRKQEKPINNLTCPKCKQAYPIVKNDLIEKCPKCRLALLTLEEFLEYIKR